LKLTRIVTPAVQRLARLACQVGMGIGVSAACPALMAQSAEPAPPLKLSALQLQRSGVQFLRLQPRSGQITADAGPVLAGTVMLSAPSMRLISAPLTGVVQSVLVAPMQRIQAGQVVATLQSPQLLEWQREFLLAETQLGLAQAKLAREERLLAEGVIAELRVLESRAALRMAQASASERRQALRLAGFDEATLTALQQTQALTPLLTLRAPVTGAVLEQNATPGQHLEAGAPVLRMILSASGAQAPAALWVEFQVAAAQAPQLGVGQKLRIQGCKSLAHVVAISPQLHTANQSLMMRAELDQAEACLRPNQFVEGRMQGSATREGRAATLLVPAQAVVRHGGQDHVFVRTAQGLQPTVVQLDASSGELRGVLAGLKAGDEVAVQGLSALKGAWLGLGSEDVAP
jgi:membrane fusion protein, heavy metal efflux system